MRLRRLAALCVTVALLVVCGLAVKVGIAQGAAPYGPPISLEAAKQIMAAAEAEAVKNAWEVCIAIVDSGSNLVMLHRLDNTQIGSIELSIGKAKTAVDFRRPSVEFESLLAQGGANMKLLQLPGVAMEGGLPIVQDGKIIGAIGVSGVTSVQDGMVAAAGLKALK